jgi:hypothetical protein
MKTYRIQLTTEEQKKLGQVLKRLKHRDSQSYLMTMLKRDWIALR